ncbi:MAG: Rpn family recombination-promoting nuclease/putative transposase [Spirochaetaceae bacterium]|nr:Rpn family recombination-promoting nuclease/putative transposase [Spirochaetaceae bacterium]
MNSEPQRQFKKWEDLDITDDFIFSRVMRNKKLCRTLLEMILKVKIGKIKFLTSHHAIQIEPNSKGIIMDVYLKDENRVINVEMQTSNQGDLARRARYYQAAADIDTTPKGSEYKDLKENYVVFICTFDPFHCGKAIYHFANYYINHDFPSPLGDGTSKLFLTTATESLRDLDLDLQLFYDYVRGQPAQTAFTKELDTTISRMKQEKEERNMYLTYTTRMMESRRDGFDEGFTAGHEDGLQQGLERGAHQKALETAQKLIARGYPADDIADLSGLSLSQVQELLPS